MRISSATPLVVSLALVAIGVPSTVAAEDEAKARALFQQGRELLGAGKIDEACEAFKQSTDEFAGSSGAWLNLAVCREKQGRVASAWSAYDRAAEVAQAAGDSRKASAAQQFATGLEPRIPKLVISVPVRVLGLLVELDGAAIGSDQWGVALPVDPGTHALRVSAPRYEEWSTSVEVTKPREKTKVVVPRLAPIGGVDPSPPELVPDVADDSAGEAKPAAGAPADEAAGAPADSGGDAAGDEASAAAISLLAVGGAALLAGAGCGIAALVLQSDYEAEPTVEKADEGDRVTRAADAMFIIGGVAAGAGLVVWLVVGGDDADATGSSPEQLAEQTTGFGATRLLPVGPSGEPGLTAVWRF